MGIEEIGAAMPGLRRRTIAELHDLLHEMRNKAGVWKVVRGRTVDTHGEEPFPNRNDNWIPACGGTEVPFTTRSGYRLLYCYQPSTGKHAYLNCETDIILTDEEARVAISKD